MSTPTLDAVVEHLRLEAAIGGYEAAAAVSERVEAVYHSVARLLGGDPGEIAFFDNASRAWAAAFAALRLGPGDRILTGRAEYGNNALTYRLAAQRTGAEVVVVPDDADGQIDLEALGALIDRRTALIGLTHVPSSGGLVNPVAEVGALARAAGVPYLLDATQSAGQLPLDVGAIGCDFLCGTGRKFLRGPRGTGFLWVSAGIVDRLEPQVADLFSASWDGAAVRWDPGARRFEAFERSVAGLLGLGAAVDQALELGIDAIGARACALGERLRGQLAGLPGVTTADQGRRRCAIVTFQRAGVDVEEVHAALGRAGVNASVAAPAQALFAAEAGRPGPLVRLSPHYYNTEAELDRAVEVVAGRAG
jgi:selenocysteine lyase/cysteine desulfurase